VRAILLLLLLPLTADARPELGPDGFCATYPESPLCITGTAECTTCHGLAGPPSRNPYGDEVRRGMDRDLEFADQLPLGLHAAEALDSDGDGLSNLAEILAGTRPGFDSSLEPECGEQNAFGNPWYRVGEYDPEFALKRVLLDVCGRSPRFEEKEAFASAADPIAALSDTLDLCLRSPYWREVQQEIGTRVVRPIGPATDLNILGNWAWDLRLWVYATSGDRDAGDLMRAKYLVVEDPPGTGRLAAIDAPRDAGEDYAQPLAMEDRWGLITTRYSLAMNVMFSAVPRTLAAHYYRQLLGLDVARSQGLHPVDDAEGAYDWPAPLDVDGKGVWQEGCAGCHSTLDPLSYPWARYNGIDLEGGTTGAMLPDRAADILPTTDGAIFGRAISTPEEWVEAAVTSDAFSEHLVGTFWGYLFRRAPYSCEQDEFDALWQGFRDGGRNVEAMLRALILTDAYGVP
jgi:hypothetical protein